MVHKSLNGLVPEYLSPKFVKRDVQDVMERAIP